MHPVVTCMGQYILMAPVYINVLKSVMNHELNTVADHGPTVHSPFAIVCPSVTSVIAQCLQILAVHDFTWGDKGTFTKSTLTWG